MELPTLEAFSRIDHNLVILNSDEYAFIAGSFIIVKQFKTTGMRSYRFLKSQNSHFTAMDFNPTRGILATCEGGRNATIRLFSYSDRDGFGESPQSNYIYKPLSEVSISKALEVSHMSLSQDGSRLICLLPEPTKQMKVYEINEQFVLNLLLTVPLERDYTTLKISPTKKDFIFLMSSEMATMVELKDSFKENYQSQFSDDKDINLIKKTEELELEKRFVMNHLNVPNFIDNFVDCCWDMYDNIYLALTSGDVNLYDSSLNRLTHTVQGELKDAIKLNRCPTALCLTQRYLVCFQDNGKIALANLWIPENVLPSFKTSLSSPENYRALEVAMEVTPSIYNSILQDDQIETVKLMKYDPRMKKIVAVTENSLQVVLLKGEILLKEKEKETDIDDKIIGNPNEIESYEEMKFHSGKIIGVKELGVTSQFVTIGDDKKVIIWELSSRSALCSFNLDYNPTSFETDVEGNLLFIGTDEGVLRIYDISIRNIMKLVYMMKWGEENQNKSIDKIIVHPLMNYILFFTREQNILYFLSGDLSEEFLFIGYIKAPGAILDASVNQDSSNGDITILIKNFLISFKINEFKYDHKKVLEIKPQKTQDLLSNFEISSEMRIRKVDGDLKCIIKNPISDSLWLSGSEKYLRLYPLPQESLESIKKNSKSPTENPLKDFKAHDLEVIGGCLYGNSLLTFGMDGTIQVRREDKEKFEKFSRSHSFIRGGITSMFYSPNKGLIYTSGQDGSIVITAFGEHEEIPNEATNHEGTIEVLESLNIVDNLEDPLVRSFNNIITDEHNALIRKTKKSSQLSYKEKLEDIKAELNKVLRENSKLDEIEQLPKEEIIIDFARIDKEVKEGIKNVNAKEREYYRELCERQLKKNLLFENTYDSMRVKDEHSGKFIMNNNIRMVSSSSGEKILQTYTIRKVNERETERLNYVKQLRLMELHSKYKRRNENIKEVIDETIFTNGNESYLVNRIPGRIILTEDEIRAQDVADNHAQDGMDKIGNESGQFKTAKYKLQRHPYADEINYGAKQEENPDAVTYKPDEQLLKEDLAFRYKTTIEQSKGNTDLEFSRNLYDVDCSTLLYSPFELYTNFRIRNQIFLISVIIQNLKLSFNKEFKVFITDRNACLEKFNANKAAIDVIKESLLNLGSELVLDDYHYAINPHEDNEWVEKVEEADIKTPKYFSREEKLRQEQERRQEEERLKALQGDTLEMRGLKTMIEHKSLTSKQNENEEKEVVKEAWMDKTTNDMSQDELKRYGEYMRKEKEFLEKKEKMKSQNMTKLNSHKMEIDTIKTDMDSKFLKILKKKMYYDYRIAEQELIILALSRTMEYRGEIKLLLEQYKSEMKAVGAEEEKMKEKLDNFEEGTKKFEDMFRRFLVVYGEKNKGNKLVELDKNLPDNTDNVETRDEQLQNSRSDPLYFFLKDKFKKERKYGNKSYNEINTANTKFTGNQNQRLLHEESINLINQKYYYDYKNEQVVSYKSHLENEHEKIILRKEETDSRFKKYSEDVSKSKLNFDIAIRVKKGQDEISEPNGPQEFIDECILLDNHKIDTLNRKIDNIYGILKTNDDEEKDHNEILQFLDIENTKTLLTKHEIELKLRYLKLTRVTKKIQEIVTGREEIDHHQISDIYEKKKKKLEENKSKRIERMNGKLKELDTEIEKKRKENLEFVDKFEKLVVEVKSKEQIINLDNDENGGSNNQNVKTKSKSLEIAQVTKLKNLVQQYYEEIEYLRSELDKLRARTFPSFLQKPDQIIYPDDK